MQHRLAEEPRGETFIVWSADDRTWHVRSTDPQMIALLKRIAAQYGVPTEERDGTLTFVGPAEMRLGADDFSPEARQRIQFGMSMPRTRDEGIIDGRQREAVTPVVLTVGAGGLSAASGEAEQA
jgi:hypothetical protein